jgi:hypothetical protein
MHRGILLRSGVKYTIQQLQALPRGPDGNTLTEHCPFFAELWFDCIVCNNQAEKKARTQAMIRRYYSSRNKLTSLTLGGLCLKAQSLYLLFRDRDYFKGKAGITKTFLPDAIKHEAAIALSFQPFPIEKWEGGQITEDNVFDTLEFLSDHVAKPGELILMLSDGYRYEDYNGYDIEMGREEFRQKANAFLCDYRSGYELTKDSIVLAAGTDGLQHILDAEIVPYDEANVDSRVRNAILKWRNRHLTLSEKKEAVRELADVFEWLKKTKRLDRVLDKKDESAIFEIANDFAVRHHNPLQKTEYDKNIWYSWMFHFFLATYHAAIRLLIKQEKESGRPTSTSTLPSRSPAGK